MQSSLHAQTQAIQEQQSATMDSLRQQLKLMNLPPEQEQAMIKQYDDAFRLQEQQLSQQAELYNTGTGQMRTIWVRLIRGLFIIHLMLTDNLLQNVSYLMIVEIPSDEQIAAARRNLEASDGRQFGPEVAMRTVEI